MIEVPATFAVESFSVMITHTAAMNHAVSSSWCSINWSTFRGMTIAEAVATDNHVIKGIVVLVFNLIMRVEQVITQCVELKKLHSEVGDLQHLLYPQAVGVLNLKGWVQHSKNHLSLCGWFNV